MRPRRVWRIFSAVLAGGVLLVGVSSQYLVRAGGPLAVGGTLGVDSQPFVWDTTTEIQYRTDGGTLGSLTNAGANTQVQVMFQVWEDVATATIGFNQAGQLLDVGAAFTDGDVDTVSEFDGVAQSCDDATQNPVIYDTDGSLFTALGFSSGVIGFAGPCTLGTGGDIASALAALNGKFIDANPDTDMDGVVDDLTASEFDGVFIHEFGHFIGLDHSQINVNCLQVGCANFSDDLFGRPTMFPFLNSGLEESSGVHPASTLSQDDIAWVSRLYPAQPNFDASFGTVSGTILFSDGITHAQGVNVIARRVDDPRRIAVSVVSGYLFTANPGQLVTGTNDGGSPFGSRGPLLTGTFTLPVPPGDYTIEVESINAAFTGGSGVGPLSPPIANPGVDEFWDLAESANDTPGDSNTVTVTAGGTVTDINIILNGTPPRLDQFEASNHGRPGRPEAAPHAARKESGAANRVAG